MANDIRLLEDLVNKAVDQLKRLSEERNGLRKEVDALRRQLSQLRESSDDPEAAASWEAERAQVANALRETLRELRGE